MLALRCTSWLGSSCGSRLARALIAFCGPAGLVYAYALQGSIKELATVWPSCCWSRSCRVTLAPRGACAGWCRSLVASAAAIGGDQPGVAALARAAAGGRARRCSCGAAAGPAWRPTASRRPPVAAPRWSLLAFPCCRARRRSWRATKGVVTGSEFGNLCGRSRAAGVGIWPQRRLPARRSTWHATASDLRADRGRGRRLRARRSRWCVRRRAGSPLLFVGVSLIGWRYVTRRGSPWADAKALMIVSPPLVFTAVLGVAGAAPGPARLEGVAARRRLALGVLWSNALAYHDVALAPRDRLNELPTVGERIAGRGPTLVPEFEEFGKHFLRAGDADRAGRPLAGRPPCRRRACRSASPSTSTCSALRYVGRFRTLVAAPLAAREPAADRLRARLARPLVRDLGASRSAALLAHLPLGRGLSPASVPRCRAVRSLAVLARARARPARGRAAPPAPMVLPAAPRGRPAGPPTPPSRSPSARAVRSAERDARRPAAGPLRGLARRLLRARLLRADRRPARGRGLLRAERAGPVRAGGGVRLARGRHAVRLDRPGGDLHPGNGGESRILGPIVLAGPEDVSRPVVTVAPARWRSLCGRRLDWVEAVV